MKKVIFSAIAAVTLLCSYTVYVSATPACKAVAAPSGYFDVYLKNNCSKTIEVTVQADGSSSVSKYNAGEKQKVPVKAGYKIYVDGKLFLELKDSDSGKEINLCK